MILLDTHVAIWMIGDERMLGAQSRKIIRSAREENKLAISAISFWEIALLVAKDRLYCAARLRSCARIYRSLASSNCR